MLPEQRYQITEQIAVGDFATVYRAYDQQLQRHVAIKQIHPQFLEDPQKLERYWQEAQLLASLEHPCITSIYDIVRERGWLVLELMHGDLQSSLKDQAIDLDYLRLAMKYSLLGLHFLEQTGVVHGDIKPSNLLLDHSRRIKLGDFGIARRLSGDTGSQIKGTTKYMAPEVISDQFGEVGPHSDLYSLGFTAYELMCGPNFESLFPGLNMYGRDEQMAWMMWHTTADRRLPDIDRVLEGVPEDLSYVIQKLIEKDPAKRYRSAEEVMDDLRSNEPLGADDEADKLAEEVNAQAAKKKRLLLFAALGVSMLLSVGMFFIPSGPGDKPPVTTTGDTPSKIVGSVQGIDVSQNKLSLLPENKEKVVHILIKPDVDEIKLDGQVVTLDKLLRSDHVRLQTVTADGKPMRLITATRPKAIVLEGRALRVEPDVHFLTAQVTDDQGETEELRIRVPGDVVVEINGSTKINNRRCYLSDLRAKDRIVVDYVNEFKEHVAQKICAWRISQSEGTITSIDLGSRVLSFADSTDSEKIHQLVVAADAKILVNDTDVIEGKPLTLEILKIGDRITVEQDSVIHMVSADRFVRHEGTVDRFTNDGKMLVFLEGKTQSVAFELAENCSLKFANTDHPARRHDIHSGDRVEISHESIDLIAPMAKAIKLHLKPIASRFAIIISQAFGAHAETTKADVQLVHDTLMAQYRVPEDQLLQLEGSAASELLVKIPEFLSRTTPTSELLVYVQGPALIDDAKIARLIMSNWSRVTPETNSVPIKWLIGAIEKAPASERTLLFDGIPAQQSQVSSAELLSSLQRGSLRPVSSSVLVIASTSKGQSPLKDAEGYHGLFARVFADAFHGAADSDDDQKISRDELFDYLEKDVSSQATSQGESQNPVRFLPAKTNRRLPPEAIEVVARLRKQVGAITFDADMVKQEFEVGQALVTEEPEFRLLYGLILLKHKQFTEATKQFDHVATNHPGSLVAHHGLAWVALQQRDYDACLKRLSQLIGKIPVASDYQGHSKHLFHHAGALHVFLTTMPKADQPSEDELDRLASLVKARGEVAMNLYRDGYRTASAAVAAFDKKIADASGDAPAQAKLRVQRRRLSNYAQFDFEAVATSIEEGIKRNP